MKYAELFAGAGGLSRGLDAAGWECVAHAEINPHARAVLRYRYPDTRLDGDVTKIDGRSYGGCDAITGGSPCQGLSQAGQGLGLRDERSALFFEQVRIWNESGARLLLWENVFGALSNNGGADFAVVLSTIVGAVVTVPTGGWCSAGVAAGPSAVAAWRVFDLQHFGPPQRRARVFIVADRTGRCDPAEILQVSESVCGHPSPRDTAGDEVTGTLTARTRGGGGLGTDFDGGIVCFHQTQDPISSVSVSPTLGTQTSGMGVVAFVQRGRDGGAQIEVSDVSPALRTPGGGGSMVGVLGFAREDAPIVVASGQANAEIGHGIAPTLTLLHETPYTLTAGRPRQLMPIETDRLMSWPDDWTRYGINDKGQQYELSDTQRYRLCGNGVGSVCVQWIAQRLADAITSTT